MKKVLKTETCKKTVVSVFDVRIVSKTNLSQNRSRLISLEKVLKIWDLRNNTPFTLLKDMTPQLGRPEKELPKFHNIVNYVNRVS